MGLYKGISYNLKGLRYGLTTPSLLFLGLLRFMVMVVLTLIAVGLVLTYHREVIGLIWQQPQSLWILWLWYLVSWLVAALLSGMAAIAAFLVSQVLFSVLVMEAMSRITERRMTGREATAPGMSLISQFLFLLRQEVPRTVLPILAGLLVLVLGWFTPLSPLLTVVSPLLMSIFLAWDNTDLVPARRQEPFKQRFGFLKSNLGFHLGFGLLFLIPGLNILLLSFAPVGATLFYLERNPEPPEPETPEASHASGTGQRGPAG